MYCPCCFQILAIDKIRDDVQRHLLGDVVPMKNGMDAYLHFVKRDGSILAHSFDLI